MKKIAQLFGFCMILNLFSCQKSETRTQLDQEALDGKVINIAGENLTIQHIMEKHKGKTILIDVWASWCPDCVKSIPDLKKIQQKYGENIDLVFLSLDRNEAAWKKGIEKHSLVGDHYWLQLNGKDWKTNSFAKSINLKEIPNYMVISKDGEVKVWGEFDVNKPSIDAALEKDTK